MALYKFFYIVLYCIVLFQPWNIVIKRAYLTAIRTLAKENVETVTSGWQSTQPL